MRKLHLHVEKLLTDVRKELLDIRTQHPHVRKLLVNMQMLLPHVEKLLRKERREAAPVRRDIFFAVSPRLENNGPMRRESACADNKEGLAMNDYQRLLLPICGGLLTILLLLRCAERKGRLRHLLSLGIMLAAAAVIYLGKDDKAVWIPALVTLLVPVALEVLSSAPVASDSVGIEKFQEILEEQHRRVFLEEQKRQVVEAKLADIEKSWQKELELRKETQANLAKLKGLLSDEQIRQAQAKVEQGDKEEAEKAFDAVADEVGRAAADAAFQSGKLAEDRLDYAKAMRQYRKAVLLEKDNPDYLLAAGKMARTLADHAHAQEWLERLLEIRENEGKDELELASAVHEVAGIYYCQCKYPQAEMLYKRSLKIKEKCLGEDHSSVAITLNNLGELYRQQSRYDEAEPLYKRSLVIREDKLGKDHPDVAQSLNNLAGLYESQGKYAEAELLYKRDLSISEKFLGEDHPDVATTMNNLGELYRQQSRYNEAEPLYKRSLEIKENKLGKDHPSVALILNNIALLYAADGRYDEAERLYKRSLVIREDKLGKNHPDVAQSLNNLAALYKSQGCYDEAEPLYKRSLEIKEEKLDKDHPEIAATLNNLAGLYKAQGKYNKAEPLYQRALAIMKAKLPAGHPYIKMGQENYDDLKRKMAGM